MLSVCPYQLGKWTDHPRARHIYSRTRKRTSRTRFWTNSLSLPSFWRPLFTVDIVADDDRINNTYAQRKFCAHFSETAYALIYVRRKFCA